MVNLNDSAHERHVEFLTAASGSPTVRVTGESARPVLLHSKYDPQKEAAVLAKAVAGETAIFIGAGLGYHVAEIISCNPNLRHVVLVERYPELAEEVVRRLTFPGVIVHTVLEENDFPAVLEGTNAPLILHPPSISANPSWYACMQAAAGSLTARPLAALRTSSSTRTILVPFEAYYCQREVVEALKAIGHRVVSVDYRKQEHLLPELMREAIVEHRPDLVLCINMRGLDRRGIIADMLKRLGIPLALWFVDSPEFILYGEALPPPDNTTIFMWDRSYVKYTQDNGYRTVYLPLAADIALLEASTADPSFSAPVSFVGNSLASGFLYRLASRFQRDDVLASLADSMAEGLASGSRNQLGCLDEMLQPCKHLFTDDDSLLFFRAYVLHAATTKYRTRLLSELLPEGLIFFGDPDGWRRIFGLGIDARPDVNYFRETPKVYANSAISVNATSLQMPTAVNQRVFDVPLCGGFLLTDRQSDVFELFGDDVIATYGSTDEARDKVRFYLDKPDVRQEMSLKARERVLAEHTYRHRMEKVLKQIFGEM